jgi:hypothetical protein
MRTGLIILTAVVIVGLLAGIAIPNARATTASPGDITFHVLDNSWERSINLTTIPPDQPDVITLTGSVYAPAGSGVHLRAYIDNLCGTIEIPTGTPSPTPTATATPTGAPPSNCYAVDIYYKVSLVIHWDSNLQNNCGPFGYCSKNLPPQVTYIHGGASNILSESFACGVLANAGSCAYNDVGIIPTADISRHIINSVYHWNEEFDILSTQDFGNGGWTSMTYEIQLSTLPIHSDCAGQYNIGAVLGSFTLAATNSAGTNLQTILGSKYPAPGQWYVVQVTSGSWQNNGTGAQLKTLAQKGGLTGAWFSLIADPIVGCSDTDNNTYYLQMISTAPVFLRADDTDGNFADNTGSMVITISAVTAYSPYPDGCELQYKVGDLIEQRTVNADQPNGWPMKSSDKYGTGGSGSDVQPTRYYMLETIGGPANLGILGAEDFTWDADLGLRDSASSLVPSLWYEIQTAPFVECVKQTDIVGHVRVFFAADSQATLKGAITNYYYAFRVRDTGNYVGNSGSLGYRLYEATNMQMTVPGTTPSPSGCARYSHAVSPNESITIPATSSNGQSLTALMTDTLYALEVVNGPWKEGGVSDRYTVEITDDDGGVWHDLESYPNLLCAASSDGNHYIIYLYGAAGKTWRVRVNDGDNNFANNTLSIGLDVYTGLTTINEWPACTSDYNLTRVVLDQETRTIAGNMADGKAIPASSILGASRTYAIEILPDSKWYEAGAGAGSYLVDISDDGGTTWVPLESYTSLCTEQIGNGDRFRVIFTATSGNYKLRVRDGDSDFLSNTGYVLYDLYKAINNNYNPGPDNPNPPPAEWMVACNENYSRPNGYFTRYPFEITGILSGSIPIPNVGEWIDYLRNAITYYFAWCPQHTDALKSIGNVAMDKDPMATIVDMVNFVKSIQALLVGYQAQGGESSVITSQEPSLFSDTGTIGQGTGGSSGPEVPAPHGAGAWDLFTIGTFDPATNFWFGGKINLNTTVGTPYSNESDAYVGVCTTKFYSLFGIFSATFCGLMGLMRFSDIINWALLILDLLVSVWFIVRYIPGYCKKTINLLTGKQNTIIRMIGR